MSTFVNSPLKIELIGTGEQVGTWGDTTNNNLKALQEAITGSATVDFSGGNVTLALSDSNALTTARNLRLVCTGATANSDLILGSGLDIEKLYLVQNDTSYTITVKRSGGLDAGVAIVAGGKRFVFNNGTNVIEATNINLASGVSGTLPVANGGTGQTSYTDGQLLIGTTSGSTLTKATLTGTANRLTVTNGSGSITLNVDATDANTASKVVARDASGNFSAGTITATLSGNASTSSSCSGNAATATALQTARTIGGVSFDGTANINLPGVNTTGDQDTTGSSASCSGNASTATTLQTARTINGTSFDGSANITVPVSTTQTSTALFYDLVYVPDGVTGAQSAFVSGASNRPKVQMSTGVINAPAGMTGNASTATALSTVVGSAPSYAARAWVNFDGTAVINFIRDSGNVSSVTSSANGIFTINFSTGMIDNDYACVGSAGNGSATRFAGPITFNNSSVVVITESQDGTNTDFVDSTFVVFR